MLLSLLLVVVLAASFLDTSLQPFAIHSFLVHEIEEVFQGCLLLGMLCLLLRLVSLSLPSLRLFSLCRVLARSLFHLVLSCLFFGPLSFLRLLRRLLFALRGLCFLCSFLLDLLHRLFACFHNVICFVLCGPPELHHVDLDLSSKLGPFAHGDGGHRRQQMLARIEMAAM